MNSYVVAFFALLAVANAGVLLPAAKVIQGPSSRTTVVGPDGSAISSVQPGGQIVTEEGSGIIAHNAPVVAAYSAPTVVHSAPAVAYAQPSLVSYSSPSVLAYSAPAVHAYSAPAVHAYSAQAVHAYAAPAVHAYSAPAVHAYSAYSAPVLTHGVVAEKSVDTIIAGPSGTIATSKTVASPALVAAY